MRQEIKQSSLKKDKITEKKMFPNVQHPFTLEKYKSTLNFILLHLVWLRLKRMHQNIPEEKLKEKKL